MDHRTTVPYCILVLEYGPHLRTMRVPEDYIARLRPYGWRVLIRDSEMPPPAAELPVNRQSGRPRRMWLDEADVAGEFD